MGQNTSSAVMQQRLEAQDSLDDFPTPPWATRALCETLLSIGEPLQLQHVWEPACNRGHMARPLAEYFDTVHATDVHDYGWQGQHGTADFLIDWGQDVPDVDWVVTNPPFRLADDFIRQGLRIARRGVAVLVRSAFVEGAGRYDSLFRHHPEELVLPFVERVVMWKGQLLNPEVPVWKPDGKGGGAMVKPSTATAYQWLVYDAQPDRSHHTLFRRIAPCRRRLTRPGDYPPLPDHLRAPGNAEDALL